MTTVLVVDDEPQIARIAQDYLRHAGFEVVVARDGPSAVSLARSRAPDLIVLDLALPGLDGVDVTRTLRRESNVPIIMLTARVEESDRLLGLELGADDYISKPFSPRELVARVRAVLRRADTRAASGDVLRLADLTLDVPRMKVTRRTGRTDVPIDLTPTEFQLLATLARQPGRIFTRAQLLDAVRGIEVDSFERAIDAHVKNIRRKIEVDSRQPRYIVTVYGMGLIFISTYLLVFFAMRRIGTPLGDIVFAADRVASGDYDARVVERGTPFLRRVARAFNGMTAALQAQDRQRRQLMADIAHELRTPLTIVQGRLEGLVDGVYPRDEAQLTEVLEETRMLTRLVDDLRTLANAEAGSLSLHKEPTDLALMIHDAMGTFAADAAAARIALRVDDRAELPLVDVDPLRVREVLINLLANALRHTTAGGTITVTAGATASNAPDSGTREDREAREARMIVVSVSDTGSGITPDDLPRIFDRFYKGATSHGSGLGLAIVRNLVIAHGGDVTAASELGRGTTITFTLPIANA